jgi:proliferating cell nuclear antigen PCNA
MRHIFKVKTRQGYTMKMLVELLQNNIKLGCFVISEEGIFLQMSGQDGGSIIDVKLPSNNFTLYKFKYRAKKLFVGLNMNHFHKMLKSIKKKDSMELFIDESDPSQLGIRVIPKENNRITTSFVTIQNVQNIMMTIPAGYGKPVIIPSNEFQKLIKDMSHIGPIITIISKEFYINFTCNAGGIMKRHVEFGEVDTDDEDDEKKECSQEFDTKKMGKITKLAGLSDDMKVFQLNNLPIMFESPIGGLGTVYIYVKDRFSFTSNILDSDSDSE